MSLCFFLKQTHTVTGALGSVCISAYLLVSRKNIQINAMEKKTEELCEKKRHTVTIIMSIALSPEKL